jgi:hypothetical protein
VSLFFLFSFFSFLHFFLSSFQPTLSLSLFHFPPHQAALPGRELRALGLLRRGLRGSQGSRGLLRAAGAAGNQRGRDGKIKRERDKREIRERDRSLRRAQERRKKNEFNEEKNSLFPPPPLPPPVPDHVGPRPRLLRRQRRRPRPRVRAHHGSHRCRPDRRRAAGRSAAPARRFDGTGGLADFVPVRGLADAGRGRVGDGASAVAGYGAVPGCGGEEVAGGEGEERRCRRRRRSWWCCCSSFFDFFVFFFVFASGEQQGAPEAPARQAEGRLFRFLVVFLLVVDVMAHMGSRRDRGAGLCGEFGFFF